jgi:hypothetical protein
LKNNGSFASLSIMPLLNQLSIFYPPFHYENYTLNISTNSNLDQISIHSSNFLYFPNHFFVVWNCLFYSMKFSWSANKKKLFCACIVGRIKENIFMVFVLFCFIKDMKNSISLHEENSLLSLVRYESDHKNMQISSWHNSLALYLM